MITHNRIAHLFQKKKKILSVFLTLGYPSLDATIPLVEKLVGSGVDMIELGLPFSDPIADGPVIRAASEQALQNGMTTRRALEVVAELRTKISIPLILMGSLNPIYQFGVDAFCREAIQMGIDGMILPDLPFNEYERQYRGIFEKHLLSYIPLITSETSEERIRRIDEVSSGFLYIVSSHGVTGSELKLSDDRRAYLSRLRGMNLSLPLVVGFGIRSKEMFHDILRYADGGIIGSAFMETIGSAEDPMQAAEHFIKPFSS